jgi:hypothetical protein
MGGVPPEPLDAGRAGDAVEAVEDVELGDAGDDGATGSGGCGGAPAGLGVRDVTRLIGAASCPMAGALAGLGPLVARWIGGAGAVGGTGGGDAGRCAEGFRLAERWITGP